MLQTLLLCTKLQWSISFPNYFPSLKSLLRTDPRSGITDLGGLSWTAARHLDSSPRDFKALPSPFHTVGLFLVPFRVINSKHLKSQGNRLGRILQNQIYLHFFLIVVFWSSEQLKPPSPSPSPLFFLILPLFPQSFYLYFQPHFISFFLNSKIFALR